MTIGIALVERMVLCTGGGEASRSPIATGESGPIMVSVSYPYSGRP
ncbi:MAG TPA: hypothetical protein VGP17_03880 [Solirubrobacteraceae bacterium]|jgi:hypothetical protein|nr:hypothetical protein [Solirubrobacteraceae bacterium]